MAQNIRHILLIPVEGDPHGLLREGPLGARPPTISTSEDGSILGYVFYGDEVLLDALVLAWNGEPVPEGCDRTHRCLRPGTLIPPSMSLSDAHGLGRACADSAVRARARLVVVRS